MRKNRWHHKLALKAGYHIWMNSFWLKQIFSTFLLKKEQKIIINVLYCTKLILKNMVFFIQFKKGKDNIFSISCRKHAQIFFSIACMFYTCICLSVIIIKQRVCLRICEYICLSACVQTHAKTGSSFHTKFCMMITQVWNKNYSKIFFRKSI